MRRLRKVVLAGLIAAGLAVVPAGGAGAVDDTEVGPVSVRDVECDPTVTDRCEPWHCEASLPGTECVMVCADVGSLDPCVYTTPGGFVAQAQGACVGYLGEWDHACANGVDGCGVQVWGSYLLPSGSCGE